MDSSTSEITHEFPPFFRVYKDGRVERFRPPNIVPPSTDPQTGVQSKDVVISPETGVSARLFLPKTKTTTTTTNPTHKLPLLIYIHGGGFCIMSAFSSAYHNYLNSLVAEANVLAISVDYRLAPEHPLPIAYDDAWIALQWVVSHSGGKGQEPWLNDHADFQRVHLAGDSAGANIAHNVAVRAGVAELDDRVKITAMALVHPFFGGKKPDRVYQYMCPSSSGGDDDPRLNPAGDPRLKSLGCSRVLVCVAEKDWLRDRGLNYYEALGNCGWGGVLEIMETEGEDHAFHLFKPSCEKAVPLLQRLASFLNQE